jgi:hypothetical protein
MMNVILINDLCFHDVVNALVAIVEPDKRKRRLAISDALAGMA